MPAPTLAAPAKATAQPQGAKAPAALVPFTRASRKMSRIISTYTQTMGAGVVSFTPVQIPAAGYARRFWLTVTGTTSGNSAAVAFQPDAPWNVLQNVTLQTANGDALTSPLDGYLLYAIRKYLGLSTHGVGLTTEDPAFSLTTGTGATGGSFKFRIPLSLEIDARDAFGALENMAANQSYLLQYSLNSLGQVYSTAPTNAPVVTARLTMEYWAAPNSTTAQGVAQQTAPTGDGSVGLLQTQQPSIIPGTNQNIQLVNVGNTVRSILFIARNSSGVRDDADWPDVSTIYQNGQPLMVKTKDDWLGQMHQDYRLTNGRTATPTTGASDVGVFVITDFMNDGASGDEFVSGAANRDLLLVTGSATALNYEATSNWGNSISTLQILQHNIRPASPQALYPPFVI